VFGQPPLALPVRGDHNIAMVIGRSLTDDARRVGRERFVGRSAEIALFDGALGRHESRILWLFGPGGIGKSSLLRCFADRAVDAGCSVVAVDLRAMDPSKEALVAAFSPSDAPGRLVVCVDTLERVPGSEEWLRTDVLSRVPVGTVVVLASRLPPPVAWRVDGTTGPLTTTLAVRGLGFDEASDLLERFGVSADDSRRGARIARGHPLALSMLSEALAGGAQLERLDDAPDLVAMLLAYILDDVPDDQHRRALEVCSVARVTTRSMLRTVVSDGDAGVLFEWLATRTYIDRLADGLCPHDLVRDLLEVDLRASDPERYREQKLSIRRHILAQQEQLGMVGSLAADLVYLHRFSSVMGSFWDWSSFGSARESALTPADESAVEALVARHNPAELVPVVRYWMRRQPGAFRSAWVGDELIGMYAFLVLSRPDDEDLVADPVIAAVWRHALGSGRLRPGEAISVQRFFEDRDAGQATPSRTVNPMSVACTRQWMLGGHVADYVACVRDIDAWMPMFDYLDFRRAPSADALVGDQTFHVAWRDWRDGGRAAWLEMMESRELGGTVSSPQRDAPVIVALTESDFADAVRDALRDLSRPDRLARSPLLASRLVRDRSEADPVAQLRAVLHDALVCLPEDPRVGKARRAVDRTYFHGAVSQEAAAEVLDMAFSTYRRHLKAGLQLLIDQLWRWEIYGRSEDSG
jgi:hypothetical protein